MEISDHKFHCLVNWTGQHEPKPDGFDIIGLSSKPDKVALAAFYEYLLEHSRKALHKTVLRTILHSGKHVKLVREAKFKYLATIEIDIVGTYSLATHSYAIRLIDMDA